MRAYTTEWCFSNQQCFPPDGFMMTTTSKRCRDGGDRWAKINDHHAPNRYSNHLESKIMYLNYLYWTHHEWITFAHYISSPPSTTVPRRQKKCCHFTINRSKQIYLRHKNSMQNIASFDEEDGSSGGRLWHIIMDNYHKKGGAVDIFCQSCWSLNSNSKLPQLLGATLIWKKIS